MREQVKKTISDCITAVTQLQAEEALTFIEQSAEAIAKCFQGGNKIIIAGNGGSLCDAAHFAEELTGQFREKRAALPAIVLNEPGHITCVGNDYGFEEIFSRGVEAFGQPGDIFIGLTTSGKSPNIMRAVKQAKTQQMTTIAFLGKDGGLLKGIADLELIISGFTHSDRIQEAHMAAIHIVIQMVESMVFSNGQNLLNKMVACSENGNVPTST